MGPVCKVTVKPKLISEESRVMGLSCHIFDHKTSLFSSGLRKKKKKLCQSGLWGFLRGFFCFVILKRSVSQMVPKGNRVFKDRDI